MLDCIFSFTLMFTLLDLCIVALDFIAINSSNKIEYNVYPKCE